MKTRASIAKMFVKWPAFATRSTQLIGAIGVKDRRSVWTVRGVVSNDEQPPELVKVFEGLSEELVDLPVEFIWVLSQCAVPGVRNNPEVGVRDVLVDEDGVRD